MEDLFNTKLVSEGREEAYHVFFDNEAYHFKPQESGAGKSEFILRRENDEWHTTDNLPEGLKDSAINALERYLLKQH